MLSTIESINAAIKYVYGETNNKLAISVFEHYKVNEYFQKKLKISKWLRLKKEIKK